jgi:hypothetical protein
MLRGIRGRFSRQRAGQKALLIVMVVCFSIPMGGYLVGVDGLSKELVAVRTAEADMIVTAGNFTDKIENAKDDVINRLAQCESGGHKADDGILVFDTNNKASIGELQFQKDTVRHYVKKLYGKDITGREAVIWALDTGKARQLAKDIIFTTENGVGADWVNCDRWHGLSARVELIKEFEN